MANKRSKRRRRHAKYGFAAWSKGKKAAVVILSVFVALMTLGVVLLASKIARLNTTEKLSAKDVSISKDLDMDTKGYMNVAIFGVDSRESQLGIGTRSDTIIIASLNNKTKEVRLVSVYRDTLLKQEDGTYNKANAAYSFGGPKEAIALLNRNLDMNITHYVTVNFDAMVDVVDAFGGVEIDVKDYEIPMMCGYGTEIIKVTGRDADGVHHPGRQVVNGTMATAYCRIRKGGGDDYRRTERQREVIAQIVQRAQKASLSQLNRLIDKVFPEISTNFTMQEMMMYAKNINHYHLGQTKGFPDHKDTAMLSGIGDCVIATDLEKDTIELHHFLFGDDGYTPTDTVREVAAGVLKRAGGKRNGSDIDDRESTMQQSYEEKSSYQNNKKEDEAEESRSQSGTHSTSNKKNEVPAVKNNHITSTDEEKNGEKSHSQKTDGETRNNSGTQNQEQEGQTEQE